MKADPTRWAAVTICSLGMESLSPHECNKMEKIQSMSQKRCLFRKRQRRRTNGNGQNTESSACAVSSQDGKELCRTTRKPTNMLNRHKITSNVDIAECMRTQTYGTIFFEHFTSWSRTDSDRNVFWSLSWRWTRTCWYEEVKWTLGQEYTMIWGSRVFFIVELRISLICDSLIIPVSALEICRHGLYIIPLGHVTAKTERWSFVKSPTVNLDVSMRSYGSQRLSSRRNRVRTSLTVLS